MAELNLNFQPEWLTPKEGSQPMSLAQAFQLKQHQQQVDTQRALLPLKQQEMQANIASAALDMKIKQEQTDLALKIKANDASGWALASQVNDWDPASGQVSKIYEAGGRGGGYSPSFATFLENMTQNAQATKVRALEAAARMRTESKPTAVVQTVQEATRMEQEALYADAADNPILARRFRKDATLLRESVRGAPVPTDTTAIKNAKGRMDALKARLAANGAPPLTPAEETAQYEQFVAELTARPAGEETTVEYNPSGTVSIKTRRGGKDDPTVATETKAQSDLMRFQASIQQLELADTKLRPEDIGIAGKIGDLNIKWLGQFTNTGDTALTANRAQAKGALTAFLDTQVTRGRLRKEEAEEYKELFFNPGALGQSYKQTKAAVNQMKKLVRMESITTAKAGGQPLKSWMFNGLDLENDFKSLRRSGTLTAEEVVEWYKKANQPVQ